MNLGQMRLEVRRAIDGLSDDFWSDDEINSWLNEGAKIMVSIAQPLQSFYQFPTVAAQQEYVMPEELDEIFSVTINDSGLTQLRPTQPERVQWGTASSGTPFEFYLRYQSLQTSQQSDDGLDVEDLPQGAAEPRPVMGLFPIPDSAKTITVGFYARHFKMRNDFAVPQIPMEFRRGIINYAIAQAKIKDEAYSEGERFLTQFTQYAERLRDKMISSGQEMAFPTVTLTDEDDIYRGIVIRHGTAS